LENKKELKSFFFILIVDFNISNLKERKINKKREKNKHTKIMTGATLGPLKLFFYFYSLRI